MIVDEPTARIGAGLHERTASRTNQRNGHRLRTLSTPAGDVELASLLNYPDHEPALTVVCDDFYGRLATASPPLMRRLERVVVNIPPWNARSSFHCQRPG